MSNRPEQSNEAAQRSAHVMRGDAHVPEPGQTLCHVCRRPMTCSYAARVLPPLVQVCSEACAADERFAKPQTDARAAGVGGTARGFLDGERYATTGEGPEAAGGEVDYGKISAAGVGEEG